MKRVFVGLVGIVAVIFLAGCSGNVVMPVLSGVDDSFEVNEGEGVVVFDIDITSLNRERIKPKINFLFIENFETSETIMLPTQDGKNRSEINRGYSYKFSLSLPEGKYIMKAATVVDNYFPIMDAIGVLPLMLSFDVSLEKIAYLGKIEASIVPYEEGGGRVSLLPLPVQHVISGFYDGMFEINIKDEFSDRRNDILLRHPILQRDNIVTSLLGPYNARLANEFRKNTLIGDSEIPKEIKMEIGSN